MPNRRFDWHEHIKGVEGEYRAALVAVDRLQAHLVADPNILKARGVSRAHFRQAARNLEGTYIVRLFAAFEAALRSYDRARYNDPDRDAVAAVLIDSTAGRLGRRIPTAIREGAHQVRLVRNYWAHENEALPACPLTLAEARARLQKYLARLPEEWR